MRTEAIAEQEALDIAGFVNLLRDFFAYHERIRAAGKLDRMTR